MTSMQEHPVRPCRSHCHQQGFSLIELMVSLAIGMALMVVMLLVFSDSSGRGQDMSRANAQIENGRYTSELLAEELSLAGFWGALKPPVIDPVTLADFSDPNPCATTPTGWTYSPYTIPAAVRGVAPTDALGCLQNRKTGTAAIVIRRVSIDETAVASATAGQFYLHLSYCANDPVATPYAFSKVAAEFTLRPRNCTSAATPVAPLRAYVSRIYFVASCNNCDASDGIPTLKRVELVGNTLVETALVDGVEDLRLEYGFDVDKNGSPDEYHSGLAAGAAANWGNVVAVKVHFITRSLDKATNLTVAQTAQTFKLGQDDVSFTGDGYLRRAYSQTVRLVNPSETR